jgi:hypothetical protein
LTWFDCDDNGIAMKLVELTKITDFFGNTWCPGCGGEERQEFTFTRSAVIFSMIFQVNRTMGVPRLIAIAKVLFWEWPLLSVAFLITCKCRIGRRISGRKQFVI